MENECQFRKFGEGVLINWKVQNNDAYCFSTKDAFHTWIWMFSKIILSCYLHKS